MVVFAKKRISMEAVVLMATHCISHWEVEGGGGQTERWFVWHQIGSEEPVRDV